MKIESVDLHYVAMPTILNEGDASQDALLVRVQVGDHIGWGECEASPLTSIASYVTPMSHSACHPVQYSVLGQELNGPEDIYRIAATMKFNSMDLLQAPHTWAGIEIALWDVLGKIRGEPVWKLLGYRRAEPKMAYASQLFGETPDETGRRALAARKAGYRAGKFGWVNFGRGTLAEDAAHLEAARDGLGKDCKLLVDAGQIFAEDVERAAERLPVLDQFGAVWLEEPFLPDALSAYGALGKRNSKVKTAGGEGSHSAWMAYNLIEFGNIGFVQIDAGRIGGIGPGKLVADRAVAKGVTFVNHTFTSHLALSASIQPYAGLADHLLAEYPFAPKDLGYQITKDHIEPDSDGMIRLPDAPGLGMEINIEGLQRYVRDVEIVLDGKPLFRTSPLVA